MTQIKHDTKTTQKRRSNYAKKTRSLREKDATQTQKACKNRRGYKNDAQMTQK